MIIYLYLFYVLYVVSSLVIKSALVIINCVWIYYI